MGDRINPDMFILLCEAVKYGRTCTSINIHDDTTVSERTSLNYDHAYLLRTLNGDTIRIFNFDTRRWVFRCHLAIV
jgi:hypothetical protein